MIISQFKKHYVDWRYTSVLTLLLYPDDFFIRRPRSVAIRLFLKVKQH